MTQPPHDKLSLAFQWIGFFLAGLLLIMVLMIGVSHFHSFARDWWKDQKAIASGQAATHVR